MTQDLRPHAPTPLWVFGYGSLLWNPEFPIQEQCVARLNGWRRAFCMWSIHHRGTNRAPGLVLALDAAEQASCEGLALQVAPGAEQETLLALRERELVSSAYLERWLDVTLIDGRRCTALVYVIDPGHAQYTGEMALEEQAEIIARAQGGRGRNCDYLWNTTSHLADLGLEDAELEWLSVRVRSLTGPDPQ